MENASEVYKRILKTLNDSKNSSEESPKREKRCRFNCTDCKDTGWIEQPDGRYKTCSCQIQKQARERIERSGLQELFSRYTFETYQTNGENERYYKAYCKSYSEKNIRGNLLIIGQTGTGKTHLATAICKDLIDRHAEPIRYTRYMDLIGELKYSKDPVSRQERLNRYKTIQTLYIDDLFKISQTDADRALIYDILDARYARGNRTIITTELSLKQLLQLDEAIAGRLLEQPSYTLEIKNINKRLEKK